MVGAAVGRAEGSAFEHAVEYSATGAVVGGGPVAVHDGDGSNNNKLWARGSGVFGHQSGVQLVGV